jgi:hypothetical protein
VLVEPTEHGGTQNGTLLAIPDEKVDRVKVFAD